MGPIPLTRSKLRAGHWGGVLALLAFGGIASLVLAEIALRLLGVSYPIFYQADPIAGSRHIPGASGWFLREGRAWVEINEDGLRDRPHRHEKPDDVFRIAVLGDSYAEAMQVDAAEAFWAVLERELAGCSALAGRRPESINFGVSGFGTAQELEVLRHRAWGYEPDFVLLAWVLNDVRNNSRALEKDPNRPYYVLREGRLVLDSRFQQEPIFAADQNWLRRLRQRIGNRSRLVSLIGAARHAARRRELAATETPVRSHMYGPPTDPDWQEAWKVSEALAGKVAAEAREGGAGFLLVLVTDRYQVHPDSEVRRAHLAETGGSDLLYANRRMTDYAQRQGIPLLDLAPPFRARAEKTGTCLHGFENAVHCGGHWNEAGNRLAGELIAERICAQLGGHMARR